ncbi:MAG: group 1 truncated hemoglobin [Myxococcales bacterium]|nr:group 1 truncated hemoglobin [Myxococcales bacterium]
MTDPTLFAQIGHARLREVLEAFYDRVFVDDMIGFLFVGKDRATLVQREWEFTARLLGADLAYSGRSIPEAHRASPIMGGHFDRRMQLLREVLQAYAVPATVQAAWLGHSEAMRHLVTRDASGSCTEQPAGRSDEVSAPGIEVPRRLKILPID